MNKFHVAQIHRLAGKQPRFLDRITIDERCRWSSRNRGSTRLRPTTPVRSGLKTRWDGQWGSHSRDRARRDWCQTQLKRLVFQTPGFDEQSGHVFPPKLMNFAPPENESRAEKIEVQPANELWR